MFFFFLGCCYSKPLLVPGGRVFIWPCVQQLNRQGRKFSNLMNFVNFVFFLLKNLAEHDDTSSRDDLSGEGGDARRGSEKNRADGVHFARRSHFRHGNRTSEGSRSEQGNAAGKLSKLPNVRLDDLQKLFQTACEQFLSKSEAEIQKIALETLEGHQRAIMGSMTVEEIYRDRKKFSKHVFEVASSDFINMGITVVSYTLKDIEDIRDKTLRKDQVDVNVRMKISIRFA